MNKGLSLIISREYLQRVKTKSFIISTILVPILMLGISMAPALIMIFDTPESKTVTVVDDTGLIAGRLNSSDEIKFITTLEPLDSVRADAANEVILVIGRNAVADPNASIQLFTHGSSTIATDSYISGQLSRAIEDIRLERYNIDNIRKILEDVKVDLTLQTINIENDQEKDVSSGLNYLMAILMDMMLYMFILIYGQMVMTSIIEEKNNRVLEIVVSSVKPTTLMMGKIVGIGLVAITQILIWAVILGCCSVWTLPLLSAADMPAEFSAAAAQLSDTGWVASLFVNMIIFFIGGYLFYSSIYAAIASAVDNIQDASQLSSVATMPVIIGIIASMAVANNPGSTLSFWISIIPFTSPMAMMSRLPFGVPAWELILSMALLYLSTWALIWLCAKIYRVGIFMYGKKPTLIEILRWVRY